MIGNFKFMKNIDVFKVNYLWYNKWRVKRGKNE
jgi:hypothetical protein